ncbi:MAG: crotonase/enoyl-CoA hydratase family protein [Hyphomicrobiaceae bacterium]
MSFATIKVERSADGVARLTLARAEKHNALNIAMIRELTEAARVLGGDASVRVVVLSGEGKSFCAGGDLDWMRAQMTKDRAGRMAEAGELASMLAALDGLPKPLIGRVHGAAYGGGVGLMAVCDSVFAADTAKFALTEVRLGLIPATIGPFVVGRIGEAGARRFMLNARTFDAVTALRLGLVSEVVSGEALDAAVAAEVSAMLECAPGAVAAAKALCRHLGRDGGDDQKAWSVAQLADRWESDEAAEGVECFFERREPSWRKG